MEQSYKEKYEDILARLVKAKNDNDVYDERFCCVIDDLIPELAENKDERIRKALKQYFVNSFQNNGVAAICGVHVNDVLDWLEKQGQVKESFISQHEIETCKENDDSLTSEDEKVREEIINYFQCQSEEEPTRKEIHDKWIAWLENIPYTIDHEKREGFHLGYKAFLERQGEQKAEENKGNIGGISPNWSEEDEAHIESILERLEGMCKKGATFTATRFAVSQDIDWLKSLRPHNQWKPSDRQIDSITCAVKKMKESACYDSELVSLFNDLRKLKEGKI